MPADPNRVRDVFLAAIELPLERRPDYLAETCGLDADLRAEVEQLLAAHAEPDSIVEPPSHATPSGTDTFAPSAPAEAVAAGPDATTYRPADAPLGDGDSGPGLTVVAPSKQSTADHVPGPLTLPSGGTTTAQRFTAPAGHRVIAGRYTLVEVIGEGGMGSVYRAEQTQPVKRQVALKLIRAGMDSRAVLARFDAERQALALMDHPNIARVYDGGTTDTGQPFFVMELVDGKPITKYCDDKRLPVRARLELFVLVCNAVQHAHQKGIIHRDLKPGNVLVTEVDGRPTPKVIDFGVAKATEQRLTDQSLADTGAIVGTPMYMSPEQADPTTLDIDTRTDVYALGVILYELLVGSPPIDAKQFKRGAILEMLRMVREVDPPRPSTKLSASEALPNIAANRLVEPAQLVRSLRGDLDWIVMKSLEKDRTRRYDTANGFAADILRHLAYEPVLAAPPSRPYRMRKFVRKNRSAVVAASLVLFALVVGIVGTTWGLIRADEALGKRDTALGVASEAIGKRETALGEAKDAIEKRDTALGEAKESLGKRDQAIKDANDRAGELKFQLALSNMILASIAYENRDVNVAIERLDKVAPEHRGWEWHHLKQQTRGIFTLHGHTGSVRCVSFSPDGMRVVTGSQDATANVWDARTGISLLELKEHTGGVFSVSFSPDGTRIVTGGWDNTAKVWDAHTGTPLFELKGEGHSETSVSFSPDSKRIVTGSWDRTLKVWDARTGTLLHELMVFATSVSFSPDGTRVVTANSVLHKTADVWDTLTWTPLLELKGHTNDVKSVSFSPDGTRITTGCMDGTAKVWDAHTGTPLLELKGHTRSVNSVAFSPDGIRIVTGSDDKTVRVWDARTGTPVLELKGHTGEVNSVSFSPDGTRVVTGSRDETAKVWDACTGTPVLVLKGHTVRVNSVSFSPDGARIGTASDDTTVKVWDARTAKQLFELKGHTHNVRSVSFSTDGTRIVTGSWDNTAKVWDASTGTPQLELKGHTDWVTSVSFSPDGTQIVTGSLDDTAKVWNARNGSQLLELNDHTSTVNSVSFSPDGTRILTGTRGMKATVWDARTGTLLIELKGHTSSVSSVLFSPDGTRILTGSWDNTAKVWDARTGTPLLELKGHTSGVNSVSYSPDGMRIITGSDDKTVRVWDARTGTPLYELKGHTSSVKSVSFSPDGTRIVIGSGDKTAEVWDPRTSFQLLELKGHTNYVTSVSFSQDGTRIVTGSGDKTAKVWDTRTGTLLLELKGHTSSVDSVSFSPDGTRIVTGSSDNTAKVWDARTGTPLLELKGHTGSVYSVSFSPDGTRILTGSTDKTAKGWDARTGKPLFKLNWLTDWVRSMSFSPDGTRIVLESWEAPAKVWDARTGQELKGEPVLKTFPQKEISPDGQFFAHLNGNHVELIPRKWDAEETSYRLIHTRPNYWRYQEGYDAARKANDRFAARFYLDRLLSMPPQRTTERFQERNTFQPDAMAIARTGFHHPALAKTPFDRGTIQMLALKGDRLAMRLVAQELMRDDKPGPAVPMLFACLVTRPVTNPPAPPVEELLLAQAYLKLNQPEEAKRFHRVAAEWLDRAGAPIRAANIVSHSALTPWAGLAAAGSPVEDIRRNPFDWESWHECDVFRAEVERQLAGKP